MSDSATASSPASAGLPTAPFAGLTAAPLPDSASAVAAVLQRFPATLGGTPRGMNSAREVGYGSSKVSAAPLREAAGAGMTMTQFYEAFTHSGQFHIAAKQPAASQVLWFTGTPTSGPGAVAAVANAKGAWLFGFEASDGAHLDALIKAFRSALR
jgi:hypothetical protein